MTETNEPGSQPLSNPKHERFALLLAQAEVSASEAYRREYPDAAPKSVEACSSRLADKVKLRIAWLKAEVERKAEEVAEGTVLSMLEKRLFLARVVRTPIGEVSEMSDLCQEMTQTFGDNPSTRIKMPGKLDAIRLDNDLAGDGSEAEGMSALVELARKLRS